MTDIKKELALTPEEINQISVLDCVNSNQQFQAHEFAVKVAKAQLNKIFNDHGVVVLDDDQSLPTNPYLGDIDIWQNIRLARRQGYDKCLEDMAGFKRVRRVAQHGL
uniref:Uncharacterized protein n=1 Tax=viral metagenome TaxID=1070528 RepID=A0A6M3JYF2_9ZZZZ